MYNQLFSVLQIIFNFLVKNIILADGLKHCFGNYIII